MPNLFDQAKGALTLTRTARGTKVRVAGIPGRTYTLQRASTANGPWQALTTVVASPDGVVEYEDTGFLKDAVFYRTQSGPFVPAIYVDHRRCIGCNACSLACKQENNFENSPATVARTGRYAGIGAKWNEVYQYEEGTYPAVRPQVIALTRQECTMCAHRLSAGLLPACVITCMGITREFGDYEELQRKYPEAEYMAAGLHKRVWLGNLAEKKPSLESSPPPPSGYIPANDCRQCHR